MSRIENVKLANGIMMPRQGFGVFQIPEADTEKTVLDAIETGYRLIDTAYSYQNESAVGAALHQAMELGIVKRDELFITTKAYIQQMGYEKTIAAFYESLHKLGLEYLDLYLVHMPLGDYYGAWRAMEELFHEGKIRAVGVCNFDSARLMDLSYNTEVMPVINQIERHAHYQRQEELAVMKKLNVQPEAWAPFAEGLKGMFLEKTLQEIGRHYGKSVPQVILRWEIQSGLVVISKSVHKERMKENIDIWDFELSGEDMKKIAALDKGVPSMLDCSKPEEIDRLYDYLKNPVLTSLNENNNN